MLAACSSAVSPSPSPALELFKGFKTMEAAWADLCKSRSLPVAVAVEREEKKKKRKKGGRGGGVRYETEVGRRRRGKEEAVDYFSVG